MTILSHHSALMKASRRKSEMSHHLGDKATPVWTEQEAVVDED